VWLTTIGGLDWPHSYAQSPTSITKQKKELQIILDQLKSAGINTVLFQTRIRGTVVYPSDYEPWDGCLSGVPNKSPGYDALEFAIEEGENYELGQEITVADFEAGKKVDVTGTSKGKGTQGNIKRHGHHRGPMTHGSKHKRLAGALAGATYPSRVFKGNKSPGRMGRETVTVQNVELVKIDTDRNLLLVKGAVPGGKGSLVRVRYAVKGQDK